MSPRKYRSKYGPAKLPEEVRQEVASLKRRVTLAEKTLREYLHDRGGSSGSFHDENLHIRWDRSKIIINYVTRNQQRREIQIVDDRYVPMPACSE